ncbi:WD40/YVTN/BNR-like repeat-containing protein [Variovorax sp. GB1P17]|uniref:WD40/YVTN/BNR-like repeat-containing protein n=1 Tax=Variovorax sp. GB1P17 TaxID=3443740 RepID=UPI003F474280
MTPFTCTVLVATAGQGILRSNDEGATWHRLGLKESIEFDGTVRALAVDPTQPQRIYAGADSGLSISTDGGVHWRRAEGLLTGQTVWSIAVDSRDPRVLFAGTGSPSRAAIHRSLDAGETWTRLAPEIPEFCAGVHRPRLLTICIDPEDSATVWFGVEEGGTWRSRDGGESWERLAEGVPGSIRNQDIHAITVLPATADAPKTALVLTVNCVHRSIDDGKSWRGELSRDCFDGLYYTRTVQVLPGSETLLLAMGDGTPGRRTRIYRSTDRAQSWTESRIDVAPNSTVWAFGVHAARPELVFAGTKYGDLYRSDDGGRRWHKEWRVFSEITAIAWTPVKAALVAHPQSVQ